MQNKLTLSEVKKNRTKTNKNFMILSNKVKFDKLQYFVFSDLYL